MAKNARLTCEISIDDFDVEQFCGVAAAFGQESFGYVVTPNVDHIVRYSEEAPFRAAYACASYVLLDSSFLANLLRLLRRQHLRVCRGSDLTQRLMSGAVTPADRVVLVGGTAAQAQQLERQFKLRSLVHIDPPMGFMQDPGAVQDCLAAVEAASPFRYCFLAVGSPRQEMLALQLRNRGKARGLALCIGASIDFLTGVERRAPRWMRAVGMEWLYRLLQNPRRLAGRYLLRGPKIFRLLPRFSFVPRRSARAAP
jgi:exopolysaccharide biosynthesis WecB/TagA/CpsF family protein